MRNPGGKIVIDLGYTEGRMSVVLHIPVAEELLPLIDRRARAKGLQREEYLAQWVNQAVVDSPSGALAAFQAEVEESDISDEEMLELIDQARWEVWAERHPESA